MDIEDVGLMIFALGAVVSLGVWVIASLQYLLPTEFGLISYWGHIEKRLNVEPRRPRNSDNGLFGTGIHFVPWFWGIRLIRASREFIRLVYKKDPKESKTWVMSGTMIQVRSKDRQKLLIEATFFLRFPYEDVDMLILIIESGVPIGNEDELREWLADAIDPELTTIFGKENYEDVMGGLKNEYLNKAVNTLMQHEDSLLRKSGVFADDATKDDPGTGEAYIKFKYIHVSGPLGERLELIALAKLEAEAAQSVAENKAKIIGGPIDLALDAWTLGTVKRMGFPVPEEWILEEMEKMGIDVTIVADVARAKKDLKTGPAYAKIVTDFMQAQKDLMATPAYKKKEADLLKLRTQEMAGGGTYHKEEIDVNSAGQPMEDSVMGAAIGTVAGIAAAWAGSKGQPKQTGGNPGKKGKNGGKPKGDKDKEEEEEEDWDSQKL